MVPFEVAKARFAQGIASSQAAERLVEGFNAQTVHPGQLAAANRDAYVRGVADNVDKWARNVAGKHTLQELKDRMQSKGRSNYTNSAKTASAAFAKGNAAWYSAVMNLRAQLNQELPKDGTDGRQDARQDWWKQHIRDLKKSMMAGSY